MKNIKRILLFLLCVIISLSTVACAPVSDTHEHVVVKRSNIASTCVSTGRIEHYMCVICEKLFADAKCAEELKSYEVVSPKKNHELTHHENVPATETLAGNIEYWTCNVCDKFFSDGLGKNEIEEDDIILQSYTALVDFIIEVESGRQPIVLQLADPQLIDSSTKRSDVSLSDEAIAYWNKDSRKELCYDLISEIVDKSNPDLILVSGDIIYGKYDDDGHMHEEFVNFMETLDIPWAPIMGNHDIETEMGATWISQLYENAPNCKFKQGNISGNGNYTIGIEQDGQLKRLIVNMDTNGCTGASNTSIANGQTVTTTNNSYGVSYGVYGLQKDQVEWLEKTVNGIKDFVPTVKISLHIHVPMNYFYTAINEAYKAKVGEPVAQIYLSFNNYLSKDKILYPERIVGHNESDFGTLTTMYRYDFAECWDTEKSNGAGKENEIYYKIKALGVDSILVGHMHSNSISVVYDGIRFQFGQKCSLFDSIPAIDSDGKIYSCGGGYALKGNTPLVGGTVMPLALGSGEIVDPYIQYCSEMGGKIDWSKYKNTIGA